MNIKNTLLWGSRELKNNNIKSAKLDADILLSNILKVKKEYLIKNSDKKILEKDLIRFQKLIKKRSQNIPIAYIIKQKEFYGLKFYIDKNVLIPRPETEILVDCAIFQIKKINNAKIADIGTGSGAIAITYAKIAPKKIQKITASDISQKALDVSKKNAKKHKVQNKIKFIKSDLFRNFHKEKYDLICANLPYLSDKELKNPDIQNEPEIALSGGKDGLNIYKKFFKQINKYLKPSSKIIIEIGYKQTLKLKKIIKKEFSNKKIKVISDIASFDRVLLIY